METLVILRRDDWDDFGFKTLFEVQVFLPRGDAIDLGSVKVIRAGQQEGRTHFEASEFTSLDEQYCSLGQDIEYYEKLSTLPKRERATYLSAMRDAATNAMVAARFELEDGWSTSLLRFGAAEHALATAPLLFGDNARTLRPSTFWHFSSELDLNLQFTFDDSGVLPGRCKVLIGYNGVGKTRLLAEIARDVSKVGLGRQGRRHREMTFGSVVAVSYSAFDHFELPRSFPGIDSDLFQPDESSSTTRFGYTYCGLRRLQDGRASQELKSLDELDAEVIEAFQSACKRDLTPLREALVELEQDPSFGRAGLRLSAWISDREPPREVLGRLSAGQKIVINIIVQLAAHLRMQSLVLVDEPETHLHPPMLAALLRAIQRLLGNFDSFAIVATHSPVVLQEVPAKDVQVLERFGGVVRVLNPRMETFGAGLGELTQEVFGLDNTVSDYRARIRTLASEMDIDQIEAMFPMGLSTQARALAARAQRLSE
ncbi:MULTISPECIES: AAA family ATPase [unclassified Leifsonia]|uniref:AAA family ATPase n=1 Tax=unclassified Leifsonia TaxID=2663824 RepID=UPI0006F6B211|nr:MULTISPECIES: AAA family ATPase [unclassified Leifsonia]KQX06763.1 hypothetical protein ASC59_02710 [Leifsonia sp. Root1293]KRA11048.1 hypothetical protein ASD61_02710 [Leifsonia sp. Root60]